MKPITHIINFLNIEAAHVFEISDPTQIFMLDRLSLMISVVDRDCMFITRTYI